MIRYHRIYNKEDATEDREATQEEGVKHASNAQLSTTKSVTVTNTSIVYVTHTGK